MAKVRANGVAVYVYRKIAGSLEFLQLCRTQHTREYQGSWQTVYGGIKKKKKETAVQAALRELKEETGLFPRHMFQVEYLESFYFRPEDYVLVMPVFAAEIPANAQIKLNEEHNAFRWVKQADIQKQFMWRTQREALAIILDMIQNPALSMEELRIKLKKL